MRSLKIALSVFGLFLAIVALPTFAEGEAPKGWQESWGFKSDFCNPSYTAPKSCWMVTNTGKQKRITDLDHCNPSKGTFTMEVTQKFFEDFRTFKEHVQTKKEAGVELDPASQKLLDASLPSAKEIESMGAHDAMKEHLQLLLHDYYGGNTFTNTAGGTVKCRPNRHGKDGYYGLCTKAALETFIQKFNDDCEVVKKKKVKVKCEFNGEKDVSYECFSSAPREKKASCPQKSDGKGVCKTNEFELELKKEEKIEFKSNCGENKHIVDESKDEFVLNFNCKMPEKKIECVFHGEDGKTYKCFDKDKGKDCVGDKKCPLTLKGPNGEKYKFESDCGTDTYEVEIGKGKNPQRLTFDCLPAKCVTGGKFDSGCLFPTWNDPKAEVIQGVIGENYDYRFVQGYIPRIINILIKFIAPIVVIMFVYTGVRFIMAGGDEDELNQSKEFFTYASIGLGFIVLSYSVMKALYFFITSG